MSFFSGHTFFITWMASFFYVAISFPVSLFHPAYAVEASCSSSGGNYTFSVKQNWQRDYPVGYFGDKINSLNSVWKIDCVADSRFPRDVYLRMIVNASPVSGYHDVYATNLDGIGVRYNFVSQGRFCTIPLDSTIENSKREVICHLPQNANQTLSIWTSLQLVKLKKSVKSGVVTSIPSVTSDYRLNNDGGRIYNLNNIWGSGVHGELNISSCTISARTMTFPIGDISASKFGNAVGTIPPGAQNTQNIGLDCDAGANINVSLQGTQNPDVSDTSVLALSGQGSAGVAKGVGVQLLYNGTPLELNKRLLLKTVRISGRNTVRMTARYYQTKRTVVPGKADASATLDLTYQ
ncbi:fimbrial protein [Morganella morganii]|uniref:fimbrial protein n=1 Tax=Morganella morganii TaxID=582 RepID=UPI0034D4C33D